MSRVNTPPRGLQDFLGNINQGVNPSDLNSVVAPTVDLTPFWGVDQLKTALASGTVAGTLGLGIDLVVPDGEVWMPVAVSGQYFVPINAQRTISIAIQDPSKGVLIPIVQNTFGAIPTIVELKVGALFPSRFVMPSGWGFRCQIDGSNDVANGSMEINLAYYEMKA